MIRYAVSLVVFSFTFLFASAPVERYDAVTSGLKALTPIADSAIRADGITLRRDEGTFSFTEGTFFPLSPVTGRIVAVIFVGNGIFSMTPPTDVERKHLGRFLEKQALKEEFTSLFLLFTDSTFEELSRGRPFVKTTVPSAVRKTLDNAQKYIRDKEHHYYTADVLRALLPKKDHNWFYAHFWEDTDDALFFRIDDAEVEEITLSQVPQFGGRRTLTGYRELVSSFHKHSDYEQSDALVEEYKSIFSPNHYITDVTFNSDLEAVIRCDISGRNLRYQTDWLEFDLLDDIVMDSVRYTNGRSIPFIKEEESSTLWLHEPAMFSTTDTLRFTLYYHGEIIEKVDFWRELKRSNGWYPNIPEIGIDRYTFDMTYRYPSIHTLVSAGKRTRFETTGTTSTAQWIVNTPTIHASFAIGGFESHRIDSAQIPITFYPSSKYQHSSLFAGDFKEGIAQDLNNSIKFFTHLFGPPPIDELHAVEIAGSHGQAFPNLLHLSWYTFQNRQSKDAGMDQEFRAHEVSHMWWGLGVSWKSYHDYWLSEGFADYSGLWYMQTAFKNNELFFKSLRDSRKQILSARKYLFASGQQSGPIWLGSRTQSSNTGGDYSLIIYKKGAWILHMLRNMAIDLKTMNEDRFQAMLRDFYTQYKGKNASTEDFQRVTEKHFKTSMQWFFDQWVYNAEVPTYNVLYKLVPLENGKFKVTCTVRQTNVPDNFQMYIPFSIGFGENRFARVRQLIKGPETVFDFPILPLKPEVIKFNDLESVLCEVDDEEWE